MRITKPHLRQLLATTGIVVVVAVIGLVIAYEPVTRNLVASEAVCSYCHLEREYVPTARLSFSTPHPAEPVEGEDAAQCVDCHLPEGVWPATFTYTHYASISDLLGNFRSRASERAGDWLPPSAARAYRVRNGLLESDSVTCRGCHVEAEIKPKRKRGQNAHKKALENKETCIECHDNLVHRHVELQEAALEDPEPSGRD